MHPRQYKRLHISGIYFTYRHTSSTHLCFLVILGVNNRYTKMFYYIAKRLPLRIVHICPKHVAIYFCFLKQNKHQLIVKYAFESRLRMVRHQF